MPFANIEYGREHRRNYQRSESGKARHAAANKAHRQRNKDRLAAHNAVSKAILRGKLQQQPCWVCGEKAQAHHPDYSRPLDVVWLCDKHHKEAHALIKP
jgi:hypothetical protein